jgi:hypothetical protein
MSTSFLGVTIFLGAAFFSSDMYFLLLGKMNLTFKRLDFHKGREYENSVGLICRKLKSY